MREWLIMLRGDRTQFAVAIEVGIAQNHYSAIERGTRNPSVKVAKRLAAMFDIDWTKFYEDEPTDQPA